MFEFYKEKGIIDLFWGVIMILNSIEEIRQNILKSRIWLKSEIVLIPTWAYQKKRIILLINFKFRFPSCNGISAQFEMN